MDRIDESGWLQQRLPLSETRGGGVLPHMEGLMTDKLLQYRMLIRNMRKMQEAGHLIRCSVCDKLVLAVNTRDGKCTYHQLKEG